MSPLSLDSTGQVQIVVAPDGRGTVFDANHYSVAVKPLAKTKAYIAYREQIEHEDDLIGMRNGWLIAGEAFLFAAYAALLVLTKQAEPQFVGSATQLFHELPWIGIALALLALSSVGAALWRSRELRCEFEQHYESPRGFPAIMSCGPRRVGHSVALLVPIGMAIAWTIVLISRVM